LSPSRRENTRTVFDAELERLETATLDVETRDVRSPPGAARTALRRPQASNGANVRRIWPTMGSGGSP